MARVRPDGVVISGQAGSGIYATPAGTSQTAAIVAMPCGQSNLAASQVIGYQAIDGADWIVRCNVDGSGLTPLEQVSCNIIVGGATAYAYSVLGNTYTQTSWGLRLDGAIALWMTDDDSLIVLSDYATGRGVACYPKGATSPSWSVPDAVTLTRYPYPQLYALDANRVLWCDVSGNFGTYGLPMPDAGVPYGGLVNPFILTDPDGALWLGYEQADQTRVRPWHDASKGYVLPTGYGQSGCGSWVCYAANAGEDVATSVAIDWNVPLVSWSAPQPPTPDPSGICFPSLPTYEKPMFCSAFFQYSLRPSSGVTDDPFGNCATLVGSPDDPSMLGKEVAMTPGALVVVGDQPESGADLNRTVAWWVSGADLDSLGATVAACDPSKPIVAYLDKRGWPQAKPAWVTPSVWPSVQVYRAPGESLEAFEAAVRADLERVAAYGGYCWVTLRLDDYNGQGSVAQTLEACPIYDRLIRDFPCIVGLHLFADERKGGMADHPELRAWGKAFAGACGPRPSRYDYCTLPDVSAVYTLQQKLLQDRGTYQLSAADRTYLLALMGGVPPDPPEPPPSGDLPDPPNGFWAVQAEWDIAPPDGTHDSNLDFCRRVAQRLVAAGDPRWGLNWKRGVVGDPSVDIVAYRWGPTDADARIVDILYAAEDPTQHAPTWSVHSVEDAGRVLWYPA